MMEMFSYGFVVRAAVVGTLVSLCAALLGVCLVQKRFSMIGDGLSHVGFGALAIAAAFGLAPLKVAVPVVILSAVILLRLSEHGKIKGDASIALFSTGALAIGVMAVSLSGGLNTDLYNYMFGSVLAMEESDVWWSIVLACIVILSFAIFYNRIFSVIFDEEFARATGVKASAYNMLIAAETAITVVIGMRMMGTMLISGLIIFPALTAKQLFKGFRSVIICSAAVAVVCFLSGLTASFYLSTPTGASIVIVNIIVFVILSLISAIKNRL